MRQSAAGARVRSQESQSVPDTPKYCILGCEEKDEHGRWVKRLAAKNSSLCSTCTRRLSDQAEQGAEWRHHRDIQLAAWQAGLHFLKDHPKQKPRGRA
jgi:hypothetical protein